MGKPKLKICKECGQSKRLKAFRAGRDVCKDCAGLAKHPAQGIKPTRKLPPVFSEPYEWGPYFCHLDDHKRTHKRKVTQLPQVSLGGTKMAKPKAGTPAREFYDRHYRDTEASDSNPSIVLGYIANHVCSRVGRLIVAPEMVGPIYKASEGPYDIRALTKIHHHYLGNGLHLAAAHTIGQIAPSQRGNVQYLGNGWYETDPHGQGVGEPVDNEGFVIEPHADPHPIQATTHKEWIDEMIKARSHSESLMAAALEELEGIPVNEHDEQPYLPSDGGSEYDEQTFDRNYYGARI